MRLWDKSLQIFKCLGDHGRQSVRGIAQQTGLSKSSVHRLTRAMERRDVHPESWWWETPEGHQWLTRLVVAAGPLPSTPAQSESESAVNGQRHALEMLAQSDRNGCALGAAMALVLDWDAVRSVLDAAGRRFSVDSPSSMIPDMATTIDLAALVSASPAMERAISFGAQQILAQHRGLWDLLEARQSARGEY